jgi:hypothetical protein
MAVLQPLKRLASAASARTLQATDGPAEAHDHGSLEVLEPGKVFIMPQGLDAQLGRQELSDLLTFLQSLR